MREDTAANMMHAHGAGFKGKGGADCESQTMNRD
jgi:hypothetical protein